MLITKFRARCIVAAVWIGSFVICSPSFLLASTERKSEGSDCRCTPSNSGMAYIVFSASSSFYLPMIIVIFVYARIYVAACAATKSVYEGMLQVLSVIGKRLQRKFTGDRDCQQKSQKPSYAKPGCSLASRKRTNFEGSSRLNCQDSNRTVRNGKTTVSKIMGTRQSCGYYYRTTENAEGTQRCLSKMVFVM